jgi:hypothetical protein
MEVYTDIGTIHAQSRERDAAFPAQSIIFVAATELNHAFDSVLRSEVWRMRVQNKIWCGLKGLLRVAEEFDIALPSAAMASSRFSSSASGDVSA